MLYSMTGFGSSEGDLSDYYLKVEIRTVNSKFFDLSIRLPRELADKELDIKNFLNGYLKRGKANVTIELESKDPSSPTVHIDDVLFKSYFKKYEEMAAETGADKKDLFRLALHSPDVITTNNLSEVLSWEDMQPIIKEAIDKCMESRLSEGNALAEKLAGYIKEIRTGLEMVEAEDPTEKFRSKKG
ncbi:MAG: YicC/YloC family endoribonuclease [Bacteroidota bacterium]